MKRSITVQAAMALAVGLGVLFGGLGRVHGADPPVISPPDLTGLWLGTYQNELNRADRGPVLVAITAQFQECWRGTMFARGRQYGIEGTVTADGEATFAGSHPASGVPGAQWRVQGCFDVFVTDPLLRQRRPVFIGGGIADLGHCCSRPVRLVLHGPG
jgi:hypothetical protein